MTYPTDRTSFKLWIREQADENSIGVAAFAGNTKLESICDAVIAEYSVINPLWSLGNITISGDFAVLPSDWIESPEWNSKILYALQRGTNPESIDLSQSSFNSYGNQSYRFGSGYNRYGNGYGLGTGSASIQDPIVQAIPQQQMPKSTSAIVDGSQKKVFILPTKNFSDGESFRVRYCAFHKVQDANQETETIAMMTIDLGDLADNFDKIFARAVKGRTFFAINTNEVAGEDKLDISKLKDLADVNPFSKKY